MISNAEVSVKTLAAQAILAALPVGGTATYSELSAAMGVQSDGKGRGYVASARRRLLRESDMVFSCVPKVGIQRLNDEAIVGKSDGVISRIRRAAIRGGRELIRGVQKFEEMSQGMRWTHNAHAVVYGAIRTLSGKASRRKLLARVSDVKALTEAEVRAETKAIANVL